MSNNSKWTPGPWTIDDVVKATGHWKVRGPKGLIACVGNGDRDLDGFKANARLIAAAPDLIEALEAILFADSDKSEHDQIADRLKARLAIAKARGEEAFA